MNRKKRIDKILKKKLINFSIYIEDNSYLHKGHNNFDGKGETHLLLKLKPNNNIKYNRLEIHKLVNSLIKEEFLQGLHSLEIRIIN